MTTQRVTWPIEGITRIPYALQVDPDIEQAEMRCIFRGKTWNYLCLDIEIPNPGDYRRVDVGDTSVIVLRDDAGQVRALVNRCAHKGAAILTQTHGSVKELMCVYHNWMFDLQGKLQSVPFERGIQGKGGMPAGFCKDDHPLTALRVEGINGLVFGTFSPDTEPLREYLSPVMVANLERVACKPFRVLGYYSQYLDSNWKLYFENATDPYHATILHAWATRLKLNRLTMEGAIEMGRNGWHHLSWSKMANDRGGEIYERKEFRSGGSNFSAFTLNDPSIIEQWDERDDGITLAIQTAFPSFLLAQINNTMATRVIVPRGVNGSELMWTILGYADDDEAQTAIRLRQGNMIGPSGFISLEDGMVGSYIQRAIAADRDKSAVLEMGGDSIETIRNSRASECGVRGFYTAYRELMGL
ncbi:MAG: aromatic ring-hydroxylating oxygenase subunit alpha [Burkholderiales bacterium]